MHLSVVPVTQAYFRRATPQQGEGHGAKIMFKVHGKDRGRLMLAVSWEIDDRPQNVTKTFCTPFTQIDRDADYARAWEVSEERHAVREEMEPDRG